MLGEEHRFCADRIEPSLPLRFCLRRILGVATGLAAPAGFSSQHFRLDIDFPGKTESRLVPHQKYTKNGLDSLAPLHGYWDYRVPPVLSRGPDLGRVLAEHRGFRALTSPSLRSWDGGP